MPSTEEEQLPEFLSMVPVDGQPETSGTTGPPQQQQAAAGGGETLAMMPAFHPGLMNMNPAALNPALLAALAGGLMHVPQMTEHMTAGVGPPQVLQQFMLPVPPPNDMGLYAQASSVDPNAANTGNTGNTVNTGNAGNTGNTANHSCAPAPAVNNVVPENQGSNPAVLIPAMNMNTMTPTAGTEIQGSPTILVPMMNMNMNMNMNTMMPHAYPFFFDTSSNPVMQQVPYAMAQTMGLGGQPLPSMQPNATPPLLQDGQMAVGAWNLAGGTSMSTAQASNRNEGIVADRPPVLISMPFDARCLSTYQSLVRQQIEIFQATAADVEANAQGRNRPVVLGQVGIRCKHCAMLQPKQRRSGSVYYPSKLVGVYQTAQNLATKHLCTKCFHIPQAVRKELLTLKEKKFSAGAGRRYWCEGARVLGVYEAEGGLLRFRPR